MTAFKRLCGLVAVLALLGGVTGCGGGGATTSASTTTSRTAASTEHSRTAAPIKWVKGKTPERLADVGGRLEGAGYTPLSASGGNPTMVRVTMHAGAWAYAVVEAKGTTKQNLARSVKEVNAQSKGRLIAEAVGSTIFVASTGERLLNAKQQLSTSQLSEFHHIVEAASGQG